jgi:hypothetical protein
MLLSRPNLQLRSGHPLSFSDSLLPILARFRHPGEKGQSYRGDRWIVLRTETRNLIRK